MLVRVLVALRAAESRHRWVQLLPQEGVVSLEFGESDDLWALIHETDFDLIVLERGRLPNPPSAGVRQIRALPDHPDVIVAVDHEDPEERANLLAAGCIAVINVAVQDPTLRDTLHAIVQRRRSETDRRLDMTEGVPPGSTVGTVPSRGLLGLTARSMPMQRLLAQARLIADSDTTVLITGETGVGKEYLARAIRADSHRSGGPFVPVNCGALPEGLLETELFGHERGAFTGATRARRGFFELAHRGTLFLDEVAELPFHLQVKLLRVLEDRRVQRVGGESSFLVDVRVMAATNRDLEEEVARGRLREDLYYRLAVVTLVVPPLRDRAEDIPDLVRSRFRRLTDLSGKRGREIGPDAMEALCSYAWPGNVRELFNALEQVTILSSRPVVEVADLPHRIASGRKGMPGSDSGGLSEAESTDVLTARPPVDKVNSFAGVALDGEWAQTKDAVLAKLESAYLDRLLTQTAGRVGLVASRAGLSPRTVFALMKKHGLTKERYRRK
ncbi:MAG: sigma-54-dependent Fis family transcriptional regulator [Candidatus Eisenbacteria bacterium]|uniref:Sigma-54-dependent Fis family transcriptional regulator n=1 Tax=Eiseniibacteriota bacterium TaxID=2212470 RepID=A0A956NI37_UNCEI|nr:sigma-54-dependent Fis family transcriptional regulator [Candidatus Eisenbacteria bacterium]